MTTHTYLITVQNQPGVLTKIAGMFYRRGHNIETLTVGKTHEPGLSKVVITIESSLRDAEFLRRQVERLVNVREAMLLDRSLAIFVEVCLARIACTSREDRDALLERTRPYRPRVVSIDPEGLTLEVMAEPALIDAFVEDLSDHPALDISRTGMTALGPALPEMPLTHFDHSGQLYAPLTPFDDQPTS